MDLRPESSTILQIEGIAHRFTEHPALKGQRVAYGQKGRKALVFQTQTEDGSFHALKIFHNAFREPHTAVSAPRLTSFAAIAGLEACRRTVFTPEHHADLIGKYENLKYAVLMPWIVGETWWDVMASRRPFTEEQSRSFATAFMKLWVALEGSGVAHCDLACSNILLDWQTMAAKLIDLEELYGPGLTPPESRPMGSPGYTHKQASAGLWGPEADRFAAAVLFGEILCWCDERIRDAAGEEQFFDPGEEQTHSERYQLMQTVLRERWGQQYASLLHQAWTSETLAGCPSANEWARALDELARPGPRKQQPLTLEDRLAYVSVERGLVLMNMNQIDAALGDLREAHELNPQMAAKPYAQALMAKASSCEKAGDVRVALNFYRRALDAAPAGSLREELTLIVSEIESQSGARPPRGPTVLL